MVGQMNIFELIHKDPAIWERFRDSYCKKQGGILRFDWNGKVTKDKTFESVKACCFTPNNISEPWDNWQPCAYERCPFVKECSQSVG